jgi:hypothetical protein
LMLDSKNEEQAAAIPVWTMVPVLLEPFSAQRISFAYIWLIVLVSVLARSVPSLNLSDL